MKLLQERLTPLLKGWVEKGPAGCACIVVRNGQLMYQESFGYADLEKKTKLEPDTIYRIYSMTKVVTCAAALMLYEKGLFLLNDPLEEYLPEFKNPQVYRFNDFGVRSTSPASASIRIKDLFTMTSGLTYGGDNLETERLTRIMMEDAFTKDIRALSKALATIPLAFDPGTHWKYGTSHDVLAALIEVLSGESFGDFLKKQIFEPLGMNDTSFRISEDKRDRLCKMYNRSEDGVLIPNVSMDAPYQPGCNHESGGSGLLSTISDYSRFAQALAKGGDLDGVRILSRKTVQLMATNHLGPQQLNDYNWPQQKGYGYGLGVRVMMNPADGGINGSPGEFGWAGLAGSWVLIDPQEQLSVVYMQQMLPSLEPYIHPRLRAVIYGSIE
ncbi:serine hydrolase domain-containing protein [Paenibacillus radicis (ex Xue et al. 2023)]|uniref:Beta-lactamase family protein n=1 Tax=Paenibacillus radicis (ex Xue et al. 2023) TaxID=2972489 RepID=A0ABT1YC52_9BACL|nr:serine hydrolase domain-containing protein [Paenibacillus radicis (ex Xue et al. 2023)]MCR8630335.1 beta-lactamase family protein [Paenibacillus radicis (ex Xue et al. 2023)]